MNPLSLVPLLAVHRGPLKGLTLHQVLIMSALAVLLAWALDASFSASFQRLWFRCTVVALVALLAFVWGGNLPTRLMPRAAWRFVLLILVVPTTVFVVYLAELGFSLDAFLSSYPRLRGWRNLTIYTLLMCGSAGLVYMLVENNEESKRQALKFELEKKTIEAQALAAQMRAMQAQVEPHFLFNTLANVQQLVEEQSPRAAPLLGNLISYLRAAVPQMRTDMTTLKREFDMAENYLAIMQMRMPDRLVTQISLPAALNDIAIPPLAIMTLVENAVRHGIDPTEHGGEVHISATRDGGNIVVLVADTGKGSTNYNGAGFGLTHLRERLRTCWGAAATLSIGANKPRGTLAALTFPAGDA
jgi:sensor histidine kinase YesM